MLHANSMEYRVLVFEIIGGIGLILSAFIAWRYKFDTKQEFEKKKFELKKINGREPSKEDLINGLGITYDEFNYWEKAFEANNIQSLDQAYDEYSVLYASQLNDPEAELQDKELKTQIRNALKVLNQREAMVAQLYYVEELNIYEISDILEISTGRISQIKKSIIEKLRNEIS